MTLTNINNEPQLPLYFLSNFVKASAQTSTLIYATRYTNFNEDIDNTQLNHLLNLQYLHLRLQFLQLNKTTTYQILTHLHPQHFHN